MKEKIEEIIENYNKLQAKLDDPELINDFENFKKISRDVKQLKLIVEKGKEYLNLLNELESATELAEQSSNDPDMREMAWEEVNALRPKIEEIEDNYIRCQRLTDDGYEVIEMPLPALVTVVKEINEPRLPSLKNMMRAKKAIITIWNSDDINADKNLCGLKGSPTQVIKTFTPIHNIKSEFLEGTPEEQAKKLADSGIPASVSVEV
ncbi:MAG TPA: PCRF domain-containing protein, partial [Bacteroidota bacterium]|nr:PCRF domain-containing protein [Bacteroidota bacterium]